MKRITWQASDGSWGVEGISWDEIDHRLYGALCKLKDYENSELSPDEVIRLKREHEEDARWS